MLRGLKRYRGRFDPAASLAFGALGTVPPGPPGGGPPVPPVPPVVPPVPPVEPPGKTFTQDEVSRIGAAESAKGKRAAAAELAAELGMSVEAAKALIATANAASEAAKTEAQRATDAAAAAKTAADALGVTAAATILASKVTRALLIAGIAPVGADGKDNPQLAMAARLVDVDAAADDAAITAAVEAVKAAAPSFFAAPPPPPPNGLPGTPPGQTRPAGTTFGGKGAAEAAKRFPPPAKVPA